MYTLGKDQYFVNTGESIDVVEASIEVRTGQKAKIVHSKNEFYVDVFSPWGVNPAFDLVWVQSHIEEMFGTPEGIVVGSRESKGKSRVEISFTFAYS